MGYLRRVHYIDTESSCLFLYYFNTRFQDYIEPLFLIRVCREL